MVRMQGKGAVSIHHDKALLRPDSEGMIDVPESRVKDLEALGFVIVTAAQTSAVDASPAAADVAEDFLAPDIPAAGAPVDPAIAAAEGATGLVRSIEPAADVAPTSVEPPTPTLEPDARAALIQELVDGGLAEAEAIELVDASPAAAE